MFESNFPLIKTLGYGSLWNAFKIISKNMSDNEKKLNMNNAAKTYKIKL